jgi:phosphatidylglycerol:prolipoprotein diacylglycerol transferase
MTMMIPYYLPYYEQPSWPIPLPIFGEVTIHAFGVLVALALIVGTWVARWHGQQRGQNPVHIVDAVTWTAISGFIIGHMVSVIFYFPERLIEEPWQLLYIPNGLSSFGGFMGGALGAYLYITRRNLPMLPFIETIAVGLAAGWPLGRLGCSIAHDHPGKTTDFFLAFDHPQQGPIHDLGFYEFLFSLVVLALVMVVRRFKWPAGTIPAMMCVVYAPVRFFLDFLRVADAAYLGLTPGQWFSIVLLIGGLALGVYVRKNASALQQVEPPDAAPVPERKKGGRRGRRKS